MNSRKSSYWWKQDPNSDLGVVKPFFNSSHLPAFLVFVQACRKYQLNHYASCGNSYLVEWMYAVAPSSCLIPKSMNSPTYLQPTSLWTSYRHLKLNKLAPDRSSWSGVGYLRECSTIGLIIRSQKTGSQFFLPVPCGHHPGSLDSAHRLLPSSCLFSSKGLLYLLCQTVEWLLAGKDGIKSKILPQRTQPSRVRPLPGPAAPSPTLLALCVSVTDSLSTLPQSHCISSSLRFGAFE